jgi:hypothetical protein
VPNVASLSDAFSREEPLVALSEKFQRLEAVFEPDITKMIARQQKHLGRYDDALFDGSIEMVSFFRGGALLAQGKGALVGVYNPQFGLFRWWFHGRGARVAGKTRLDKALAEAGEFGIPELAVDHIEGATEADALTLAKVMAHVARAEGVVRIADEYGVSLVALFEGALDVRAQPGASPQGPTALAPARANYSVAAPVSAPQIQAAISRVKTIAGAQTAAVAKVRDPSREVVAPLVQAGLGLAAAQMPQGFTQAMLIVVVETRDSKARFFVQLAAVDAAGELVSIDTTKELQDTAAKMIADDARSGNGRWGKMVVRLRRTERGASVEVTVKE